MFTTEAAAETHAFSVSRKMKMNTVSGSIQIHLITVHQTIDNVLSVRGLTYLGHPSSLIMMLSVYTTLNLPGL